MEILTLAMQDEEVRNGWRQFYDSAREMFLGLVEAARASGQFEVVAPEKSVNLMLDALEGIKLRAMFEPALCSPDGEKSISDCLMEVLQGGRQEKRWRVADGLDRSFGRVVCLCEGPCGAGGGGLFRRRNGFV